MIKAIGKLKFLRKPKIKIGRNKFEIGRLLYEDLKIALTMRAYRFKYVKEVERSCGIKRGYYFEGRRNFVLMRRVLFENKRGDFGVVNIMFSNNAGVKKDDLFFTQANNGIVFWIGDTMYRFVSLNEFMMAARVFGLKKKNMDEVLWDKVKDVVKGGTFAVLDFDTKIPSGLLCWSEFPKIVEANSDEIIYCELVDQVVSSI